ncbi:LLM class flavin-dependent oxidoreductase [Streptomyces sp. NBC_00250]|uniref:LLM class flavin-dependent oxidoreductase n=1 Tax=Streptomyces sp. NBC_00250 TaxID=2903641 RepID=UPI002E2D18C6|nr:LLM class flavin-dependent oxidoreductase [Streptomyces sp. NBC_00250]
MARAKFRRAEEIGFDGVGAADHLGFPAPFPAVAHAAEATEQVRLTTFVLTRRSTTPPFSKGVTWRAPINSSTGVRSSGSAPAMRRPSSTPRRCPAPVTEGGSNSWNEPPPHCEGFSTTPEHQPCPAQPSGPPLVIAAPPNRPNPRSPARPPAASARPLAGSDPPGEPAAVRSTCRT